MCGIAGFSLTKDSTINARALTHHLFAEITSRGNMAAGFAYATEHGAGYYKAPESGAGLRLKGLPRDAKQVILHTRMATHGDISDNRNNHPVTSPDDNILLTHNGVIWNYDEVIRDHLAEYAKTMPEVDTAVIPAVIQKFGVKGLSKISGDAAIAWIDASAGATVHLARLESSPVNYTTLDDGSFVYASTEPLLRRALANAELNHGPVVTMKELSYLTLDYGVVTVMEDMPEQENTGFNYASYYRDVTSGKKSGIGSSFGSVREDMRPGYGWDDLTDDDFEDWSPSDEDMWQAPRFYSVDHDGEFKSYYSIGALVNDFMWYSDRSEYEDLFANGDLAWVNHFRDVGAIDQGDGQSTLSWVAEPDESWTYEPSADVPVLGFIREGIAALRSLGFMV